MTRQNNPHQHDVGYVTSRPNTLTDGHCILYDGHKAAIDTSGGRWIVLCSLHGTLVNYTNKKEATSLLRQPADWCNSCANLAEIEEAEYILTLRTKRTNDEQLKRLASLAVGDPEKSQLFERLTGKQPEYYLSDQ
jgi:hypothetical protein